MSIEEAKEQLRLAFACVELEACERIRRRPFRSLAAAAAAGYVAGRLCSRRMARFCISKLLGL